MLAVFLEPAWLGSRPEGRLPAVVSEERVGAGSPAAIRRRYRPVTRFLRDLLGVGEFPRQLPQVGGLPCVLALGPERSGDDQPVAGPGLRDIGGSPLACLVTLLEECLEFLVGSGVGEIGDRIGVDPQPVRDQLGLFDRIVETLRVGGERSSRDGRQYHHVPFEPFRSVHGEQRYRLFRGNGCRVELVDDALVGEQLEIAEECSERRAPLERAP